MQDYIFPPIADSSGTSHIKVINKKPTDLIKKQNNVNVFNNLLRFSCGISTPRYRNYIIKSTLYIQRVGVVNIAAEEIGQPAKLILHCFLNYITRKRKCHKHNYTVLLYYDTLHPRFHSKLLINFNTDCFPSVLF